MEPGLLTAILRSSNTVFYPSVTKGPWSTANDTHNLTFDLNFMTHKPKKTFVLFRFCLATFALQYISVGLIFPNSLPWYYPGKVSSSFEMVGRSGFYRPVLIRSFQFGERGTRWNMQYWRKIKFLQIYFPTIPLTLAQRLSCLFKTQKRTHKE